MRGSDDMRSDLTACKRWRTQIWVFPLHFAFSWREMHVYITGVFIYVTCVHTLHLHHTIYLGSIYPSETVYITLDWMCKLNVKALKFKPSEATIGIFWLSWREKEGPGLWFGAGGAVQVAVFGKQSSPAPAQLLPRLDECCFSGTGQGRTMKRLSVHPRHLVTRLGWILVTLGAGISLSPRNV